MGWYAGQCKRRVRMVTVDDDGRCGAETYVAPGLTWVRCRACGATTYARDHLEAVLDEARDWIARPKPMAEALVALLDTEPSVPRLYTRIRQWAHQGDLQPIHHTSRDYEWSEEAGKAIVVEVNVGHARYRLGDVLDRLLRRDTRADETRAS
jgi:hypothetical protein